MSEIHELPGEDIETAPIADLMAARGVTRRQFLGFCGMMAAALALPAGAQDLIAQALQSSPRLPIVWLEFQDCTGDSESFLRASQRPNPLASGNTEPTLTELVLDILSIDYHETLMAPAGKSAEKSRLDTISKYNGKFITVVEGSIPMGSSAYYCMIGGRTAQSILQETAAKSAATIAFGTCAWEGGLPGAAGGPTGAGGVKAAFPGVKNLVAIPGCPANVVNLVAVIVNYLTYNKLPAMDSNNRPTFAYGRTVHDQCYRRGRDEVESYSSVEYRQGGCLKEMGCRGPETKSNCPTVMWNDGTCWPVKAGAGCIGCTNQKFWDKMSPFYAGD